MKPQPHGVGGGGVARGHCREPLEPAGECGGRLFSREPEKLDYHTHFGPEGRASFAGPEFEFLPKRILQRGKLTKHRSTKRTLSVSPTQEEYQSIKRMVPRTGWRQSKEGEERVARTGAARPAFEKELTKKTFFFERLLDPCSRIRILFIPRCSLTNNTHGTEALALGILMCPSKRLPRAAFRSRLLPKQAAELHRALTTSTTTSPSPSPPPRRSP